MEQGISTIGSAAEVMADDGPPTKKKAEVNNQQVSKAIAGINGGPITPKIDTAQIMPINKPQSTNYTPTNDPNTVIGKHGAVITKDQYLKSLQNPNNNMKFVSFEAFADYYGGWAGQDFGKQPDAAGNMVPSPGQQQAQGTPQKQLSDKAKGLSSYYYRANQ